ncbi:murein biosynthesis integral membrane protein MurJ, partial [bacterium K02(2017)]
MSKEKDHTQGTQKRALIATTAIMFSRVLGLVREQVFAFFFGAGAFLDAFVVAYRIPNLLRDLAAEGALSQSFITIFSQKLSQGKKEEAYRLANKTSTFIVILMIVIIVIAEIFAPQIVSVVATGFSGQKFDLTVRLMRILLPYILFVSLSAILMGMLNSQKKFFIPFSASTFGNLTAIFAGLFFAYILSPDYIYNTANKIINNKPFIAEDFLSIANAITGMAIGTLLAGLAQYVFEIPSNVKLGYKPKLDFKLKDKGLFKILKLTGPAVIAGAAVQINVLVNTEFASLLQDGAVSYLNFAFRFMQFPLGIFGVAIAAASAPVLAQMIIQKKETKFLETIQSSIQMSLFLSIPSTIGLMVLGPEIISLIYQHGQFTPLDTLQTSYALTAYAFGISSYSLIKIYQPAFLAFHNSKTPMKITMLSILINLGINAYFIFVLKLSHWALALGTAIVATSDIILLSYFFRNHLKGVWTKGVFANGLKSLLAALIMGISIYYSLPILKDIFNSGTILNRLSLVFIPIFIAVPIY